MRISKNMFSLIPSPVFKQQFISYHKNLSISDIQNTKGIMLLTLNSQDRQAILSVT